MSLLSRISLKELANKCKELNIKVYGTKTVILARIEKHFVDAELGTFNLEEYIKELHPSPHSSTYSSPSVLSSYNQPASVDSVVINEEEIEESEDENDQAVQKKRKIMVHPIYVVHHVCKNKTEALEFIKQEDQWNSYFTRLMCYPHVDRNVDQHLRSIKEKDIKDEIDTDIDDLQIMYSKETFDYALKLFKEKWRGKENPSIDDFLDYFEKVWIRETINPATGKKTCHNKWYEGAHSIGQPSSNNGLESTNRVIKDKFTQRERMAISRYLENSFDMITNWSKDRKGDKAFLIRLYRLKTRLGNWQIIFCIEVKEELLSRWTKVTFTY
jgi:hypothetical protein